MSILNYYQKEELPRERMQKYGIKALSNSELIAIILNTGTKDNNVKTLSETILSNYNTIKDLKYVTQNELMKIKGLGISKSAKLLASLELGKRVYEEKTLVPKIKIYNAKDAYNYFSSLIKDELQENFLVIYLDKHQRYLTDKILFIGTIDQSIVNPREIIKEALLVNATRIIIMHNHPSGITKPSNADDNTTRTIAEAASLFNIVLIDHIIVSNHNYYSYVDEKRIEHA